MKKIILLVVFLVVPFLAIAASADGLLAYDQINSPIQGFSPDPDKAKVAQSLTAGTLSAIDTSGWVAIAFSSTEDVRVYLNADSTKYMVFPADQAHVFVLRDTITAVRFQNGGTTTLTLSVWGM